MTTSYQTNIKDSLQKMQGILSRHEVSKPIEVMKPEIPKAQSDYQKKLTAINIELADLEVKISECTDKLIHLPCPFYGFGWNEWHIAAYLSALCAAANSARSTSPERASTAFQISSCCLPCSQLVLAEILFQFCSIDNHVAILLFLFL